MPVNVSFHWKDLAIKFLYFTEIDEIYLTLRAMQIIDFSVQQNTAKAKTNILGIFLPKWKKNNNNFLVERNIEINQKPNVSFCFIFNKNKRKVRDRVTKSAWRIFSISTWFLSGWQITESFGRVLWRPSSLNPLLTAVPTRAV